MIQGTDKSVVKKEEGVDRWSTEDGKRSILRQSGGSPEEECFNERGFEVGGVEDAKYDAAAI
jgi:hypothetical protein